MAKKVPLAYAEWGDDWFNKNIENGIIQNMDLTKTSMKAGVLIKG